jgi:hypothetical protein
MHHYRCQNLYISATASERIVDTLKFFLHNYQTPQLSSAGRLIMADNDMTNALQNPHPEVPFTHVGDDTISALTALAEILKLKFQNVYTPAPTDAPPKVTQRTCLDESPNPILTSSMSPPRQTRSQTTIHARDITNAPLLMRVVTPMMRHPSPPRVPMRSQNLSSRNLSQNDFCGMDTAHLAIALGNHHWSQQHHANAVIHPITGNEMEYMTLMKDPPFTTSLETRFWQRGQAIFPRHSRHSCNRHVFLYQTHKHPERQTDHLLQNSLRLQTT